MNLRQSIKFFILYRFVRVISLILSIFIFTACSQPADPFDVPAAPIPLSSVAPPTNQAEAPVVSATESAGPPPATSLPGPEGESPAAAGTAQSTQQTHGAATPQADFAPDTSDPNFWKTLPVIPVLKPRIRQVYQAGLALGNNPQAFSKIGDCGSTPAWFLGDFDRGERFYSLGDYQELQAVIDHFQGSFGRTSLAAKSGFNASSVFAPLWANREVCEADESPLACEYRIHRPVIAFIMLGTNDVWHLEKFEPQMRKIIEFSIQQGVIPILSTKADNLEGDGSINAALARLSVEYEVPLWNFWAALQDLPDKGLQEDQAHLTWGANRFDDPVALKRAWPRHNLTALQTLSAIWQYLAASP